MRAENQTSKANGAKPPQHDISKMSADELMEHFADRDVSKMNAEQLMELFIWLDFKDDYGHPLTSDIDFHELVERATGEKLTGTCGDSGDSKQHPSN
ncbi:MAG: hypothetical protein WBV94_05595 [Blastocatellia bacterium]